MRNLRRGNCAARRRGQGPRVRRFEIVRQLGAGGMKLYAAAARWQLGELLGVDAGRGVRAEAQAWLVGEGVAAPEKRVAMLAPGFIRT
jgi:hypothetical protein